MRNNSYLEKKLQQIWGDHFRDIPQENMVEICFGKKAKKRLGYIKTKPCPVYPDRFHTVISVNGHFKDKIIPEFIIDATIAHELCHYAHGFGSPLPQCYKHPHRGGVVDNELEARGLDDLAHQETNWLNKNWTQIVEANVC